MPLIGNVLKPLAKIVLVTLELTAAWVTDSAIQKNFWMSYENISIFKRRLEQCWLIKGVSQTAENELNELRRMFNVASCFK